MGRDRDDIERERLERWREAGRVWTDDLRLRDPEFLETAEQAAAVDASETLACISALTFRTFLNLHYMRERHVDTYLYTFMAHEIGHHVVAPAGFTNQMRLVAAAARVADAQTAPSFVNLALDLLLNDVLVREHQLPCDEIYRVLSGHEQIADGAFLVMLGAMEQLWGGAPLFVHSKNPGLASVEHLVDALVAVYELHGEGRRGGDLVPYVALASNIFVKARQKVGGYGEAAGGWDQLIAGGAGQGDAEEAEALRRWLRRGGLMVVDAAARQADRVLGDLDGTLEAPTPTYNASHSPNLLRGMGIGTGGGQAVSGTEVAIAYYEPLANGHLFDFVAEKGGHAEGYPESLREWTWGEPLEDVDWVQTSIREGMPIPGVNTLAWEYGYEEEPRGVEPFPVDLDLYMDTSGSMPDPLHQMSHIALGAFIFALSVLRQGGAVRVTVWSYDMDQLITTHEFSTDRDEVLGTLCSSIRGGTQFPVEHWERAVDAHRRANHVHTVILSDDGISTWFHGGYETGRVEACMARVQQSFRAGGTVILNGRAASVRHELPEGWIVRGCSNWNEVVDVCAEIASRKFDVDGP